MRLRNNCHNYLKVEIAIGLLCPDEPKHAEKEIVEFHTGHIFIQAAQHRLPYLELHYLSSFLNSQYDVRGIYSLNETFFFSFYFC